MNHLITITCFVSLAGLFAVIVTCWRAIKRDQREMDSERQRELRDWDENE